ncbi:MAG: hypothetical protein QM758_06525 [Armatimonas sp.]
MPRNDTTLFLAVLLLSTSVACNPASESRFAETEEYMRREIESCPGSKSNLEETVFKLKVLNSWYQQSLLDESKSDFETYARTHAMSALEATFYDKNSPTYVFHSNYLNRQIIATGLRMKTRKGELVSFYVKNGNKLLLITYKAHKVFEVDKNELVPCDQK